MSKHLGELADQLLILNTKITAANKTVDDLKDEKNALESTIISALEEQNIEGMQGKYATIKITRSIKPQIADFEALAVFVLRKKLLHLFERRISAKVYEEVKESLKGKPVPGLNEFEKVGLSVRKVTKE